MRETTRNLLVGLFVLASLGALSTLAVWFGEAPDWLGSADWNLHISGVRELSGISEGTPVRLNGVEIGRVRSLEFLDPQHPQDGVVIVAGIRRSYSVPRGAVARIYGATLGFGTGHVAIIIPPDADVEPIDKTLAYIPGEMRSMIGEWIDPDLIHSLERMIREIGDLAADARPVARHLADLLEARPVARVEEARETDEEGERLTANVATVIERFDDLIKNIDEVLGDRDVQDDVKTAVAQFKAGAEEFRKTLELWQDETRKLSESVHAGIGETRENFEETFARLNRALEKLDDASKSLARIFHGIEQGEGTAGLLARDPRLYEAAVISFERLSDLLASLRRITGKIERDGYITIGQATAVGTFTRKFPVATEAAAAE